MLLEGEKGLFFGLWYTEYYCFRFRTSNDEEDKSKKMFVN